MSLKRARSSPSPPLDIYSSASIDDRASTFIAHFSPTLSAKVLQSHPDFADASHRIAAWRKPSSQRSVLPTSGPLYTTGFDEDGEKYAGRRLARVLEDSNVHGAVVVARWYGGILLGPVRFTHIESCARDAIAKWRARDQVGEDAMKKKIKMAEEDEEMKQMELARELETRDESITVLRRLLAEKRSKETEKTNDVATPVKKIDYSQMPLERLRMLDKARDATIAFLLKQIDAAEKSEQKVSEDSHDSVLNSRKEVTP